MTYLELVTAIKDDHQQFYWKLIFDHSSEIIMQTAITNQAHVAKELQMSSARISHLMPALREFAQHDTVELSLEPQSFKSILEERQSRDRWPTHAEVVNETKRALVTNPSHPHKVVMEAFIAGKDVECFKDGIWMPSVAPSWFYSLPYRIAE